MQAWEYQFVIAEKYGKGIFGGLMPKEISWKVHYVNGKTLPNWDDMILYSYLSKMGEEGWEVVDISTHITIRTGSLPIEHLYLILKRPKS